jgi:hypothetical protein
MRSGFLSRLAALPAIVMLCALLGLGSPPAFAADEFIIKSSAAGPEECLIFGGNGKDASPSLYDWGAGNAFCGFPGGEGAMIANGQALWFLDPLAGADSTAFTLKNTSGGVTGCLIFSDNGHAKFPTRYDWGAGSDACGFPGGEGALLANAQAVWRLVPLGGDLFMIKNAADGTEKCLIVGGNGTDKYPSRYDWGAGNDYCGFPGGKNALLANKQAVWRLVPL